MEADKISEEREIRWYRVKNGKVYHAIESPIFEHNALCGANVIPLQILTFHVIMGISDAFGILEYEYIQKFEKRRFCKKCCKKLRKLRDSRRKN